MSTSTSPPRPPGEDVDSEPSEIECVVGDNWVVTAHERPAAVLDQFAELAAGSGRTGDLDGPMFLAGLLEWVLDEHSSAFERIENELEQVDSRAMRGESDPEDEIERLVTLRLQVGKLRRSLVSHRSLLLALAHPELEALGDEDSARRFELLVDRYEQTLEGARDVRESIYGSFDVLIARTGHRTNEIVKVLTLASVIFLPGALIAGIMGMNFKAGLFTHTGALLGHDRRDHLDRGRDDRRRQSARLDLTTERGVGLGLDVGRREEDGGNGLLRRIAVADDDIDERRTQRRRSGWPG